LEGEIGKSIELLSEKNRQGRAGFWDLEKWDSNGIRERAVIFCLDWWGGGMVIRGKR
jgi:hypothetical protein